MLHGGGRRHSILKGYRQFLIDAEDASRLLRAASLILLFSAALSAERAFFLLKYKTVFSDSGVYEITRSMLRGVRFDIATAGIITAPFLALFFIPVLSRKSTLLHFFSWLLLGWYSVLLSYNFIDVQYYAFGQRHLTFELASAWGDAGMLLKIGFARYLPETTVFVAFIGLFWFIFIRIFHQYHYRSGNLPGPEGLKTVSRDIINILIIAAFLLIFIRGGFQMKPLGVRNAFENEKLELGMLSLNGIYTTISTFYNRKDGGISSRIVTESNVSTSDITALIIDKSRERPAEGYPLLRKYLYPPHERKKLNVVIFIMESWSAKVMKSLGGEYDSTPFFDRLSQEGLMLTNCFANAQRSVEGLSSILGSVPTWDGMILGQDGLLSQTRLEPAGGIFGSYGYDTIFIYGARPGSMGFDSLIKRLGFGTHISRDDFTVNSATDDGVWGIYDEYVFQRAHEEFLKKNGPFFAVVYSLTSHTPYKLPSVTFNYFDLSFPNRDFLNAIRYSDRALEKFFQKAHTAPYFRDTLFIIVGDHAEGVSTGNSLYDSYHIPCLFYCPAHLPHGVFGLTSSQIDILPSILDILHISHPFTSWGKSVLTEGKRAALLPRGGSVVWVRGEYMLHTDLENVMGLFNYSKDPRVNMLSAGGQKTGEIFSKMDTELRGYLKFSFDTIRANTVMPPLTSKSDR